MKIRNVQAQPPAARRGGRPAGFTLVELLMVILIIGMLVGLVTAAAMLAIKAAKRLAISTEVNNMSAVMQDLSNKLGGEYPPCMAIPAAAASTDTPDRYTQFNRMLRKRFPRSTTSFSNGSSQLPATWVVRHGDLQNSASDMLLDIAHLDAAEALVFWLAGPPAPASAGSSTILYGFSANATTPFASNGSRLEILYPFKESQLTDADNDGWPEYTPPGITGTTNVAPFVYFDAPSYQYSHSSNSYVACYPGVLMPIGGGTPTGYFGNWGIAVPYADTATPTAWNPKSFQIICSGLDSEYGGGPSDTGGSRPGLPLVPKTGSGAAPQILQGDWDNQVNFIDLMLEDQTGQ